MVTFDSVLNLTTMMGIAVKVVIILAIAISFNIIQKKIIPRVITASIPKIRVKSQDQLSARSKTIASVLIKIIAIFIWIIAIVMVLGVIEIDIAPLLATLGVASLALGFAVQNFIRDYIQGFFIIMEDWYRIGDWVTIAGMEGEVETVGPRRTVQIY